ncbi:hypothetical protein B0I35DRAFT_26174 [Stachybotrys elegans]|uniref:Uncharacterized protein n=1 Tax=Stachybotrys elegans TaxID=80388 RepID=A0A8K0WX14_9HYPO|nr:hypothetical protein B0I35DRAFT_26174 [Stachybotrys elegans]
MASVASNGSAAPVLDIRRIPLLCTVCPETPRFSDVSHLLTHIASKGHLHHETQTKLKAHQDLDAQGVMHQYEQWYKENGIEALLVDRMRAKQAKEAVRTRRARASASTAPMKFKERPNKPRVEPVIKVEDEFSTPDSLALHPSFVPDDSSEILDDQPINTEMMSLKGQVWPGMGKMDLANEEMKRTRNQRKPRSVIERMRRTSEGIEPNQVVMTPDFKIERIKDVYDEASSPISGQEEATPPRKVSKPRTKRSQPLREISANVPRGNSNRASRSHSSHSLGSSKPKLETVGYQDTGPLPSFDSFKRSRDVFKGDNALGGILFQTSNHRDHRFGARSQLGLPNHTSHSHLVSPTPHSRDLPHRVPALREASRSRGRDSYSELHGMTLGGFDQIESSYPFHDPMSFDPTYRMHLPMLSSLGGSSHDNNRVASAANPAMKQEGHSLLMDDGSMANPASLHYMDVPGANPLIPHERMFLNSYNQPALGSPMGAFTPINRYANNRALIHCEQDPRNLASDQGDPFVKPDADDRKDFKLPSHGLWDPENPHELVHDDLDPAQLEI